MHRARLACDLRENVIAYSEHAKHTMLVCLCHRCLSCRHRARRARDRGLRDTGITCSVALAQSWHTIRMLAGTVPVAHATGGLRDTVITYSEHQKDGTTGFAFEGVGADSLKAALWDCLELFRCAALPVAPWAARGLWRQRLLSHTLPAQLAPPPCMGACEGRMELLVIRASSRGCTSLRAAMLACAAPQLAHRSSVGHCAASACSSDVLQRSRVVRLCCWMSKHASKGVSTLAALVASSAPRPWYLPATHQSSNNSEIMSCNAAAQRSKALALRLPATEQ
jgi:hypothetical protein